MITIPFHCSFCGKPRMKVQKLVPSPKREDVTICEACTLLCLENLAADMRFNRETRKRYWRQARILSRITGIPLTLLKD